MKYSFIEDHQRVFSVREQCRVLEVSCSGFYGWKQRREVPGPRAEGDRVLSERVASIFSGSRQTYGSPRVHACLQSQGVVCGEKRVARLMQEQGLVARKRRNRCRTTDSRHQFPVAPHYLQRRFAVQEIEGKDCVWCGDISYVWTAEGWLYVATIVDLFSRRVVGWAMSDSLDRTIVLDALRMAIEARRPQSGLLHHSDRGSQYASADCQELLQDNNIICSMSRKGNCWDNAPMESFFSTLKTELIHRREFATRAEAKSAIFEYIEVFYNRQRIHSSLGYLTPDQYEQRHDQAMEKGLN